MFHRATIITQSYVLRPDESFWTWGLIPPGPLVNDVVCGPNRKTEILSNLFHSLSGSASGADGINNFACVLREWPRFWNRLFHMIPAVAANRFAHTAIRASELGGNLLDGHSRFPAKPSHLRNLFLGEAGHGVIAAARPVWHKRLGMLFAFGLTIFRNLVGRVIRICSEKQMTRIAASGNVTPMANTHAIRNLANSVNVCLPVRSCEFSINAGHSVASPIRAAFPRPARVFSGGLINFFPEQFWTHSWSSHRPMSIFGLANK